MNTVVDLALSYVLIAPLSNSHKLNLMPLLYNQNTSIVSNLFEITGHPTAFARPQVAP